MNAKPQQTGWSFADAGDHVTLTTSALCVRVAKGTGTVQFLDSAGQRVLAEAPQGSAFTPATVGGASTWRVRQTFELAPDEGLFGLGQHPDGFMNHRGTNDRLRYHLLPYIYSVAWRVTDGSYTMLRPLVMDFRSDARVHGIADQLLFGPALLANPVMKAGAKTRGVYLPAGARWTDFWTGESHAGGQSMETAAPIERMPLFVRAGSILPYGPALQYAAEKPADPLELRVYRGADGDFTLYEDEGDNYNYETGGVAKTRRLGIASHASPAASSSS